MDHDFASQQVMDADTGFLQVRVLSAYTYRPVSGALVEITPTAGTAFWEPDLTLDEISTDTSGLTEMLPLPAPPVRYSMASSDIQPYSQFQLRVTASGYEPLNIIGTSIFANEEAIQPVLLRPLEASEELNPTIIIPNSTLFEDFPPKIAEAEIKPIAESGEMALSRIVIPETIVVHDGTPANASARNYIVPYKDYIKNVASCGIYSTWPRAALTANILAMMSFTLNRVYTEWYRSKGYDFTITSSSAHDQKWGYGRNIFDNISEIVDEIFTSYLSRPDVRQPIFTQSCDGRRVSCPNWLSQWGSRDLGEQGYSAIEILRNFYGDSIYINTAEEISGIPYSSPVTNLDIGSSGQKVSLLQEQLNTIGTAYPSLPSLVVDELYGENVQNAVRQFQSIFGLPATGITDFAAWFKISEIYRTVTRRTGI